MHRPPCNCPPPFPPHRFPRPEPFSPGPGPCREPDRAAWLKAQLAKKYEKPDSGIPKADLAEDVRTSLGKADAAVQPDDILSGGKVKSDLLPSYVDDVIEVAGYASLPNPGEEGKIYVTLDTNKTYRWGGTEYVEISNPDLSNYKPKQTAVPDPTASGTATAFIDAITQDANGVITPTKKGLPEATTSVKGIVQLDTALTASGKAADAKATGDALAPLQFAQYYPDGGVTSAADFTAGIKYAAPDTTNRTIMVRPFCVTPWTGQDNSSLVGRVVIPPFVDAQFNPYISDDGTRYRVVGIAGLEYPAGSQDALTAVVAPNTVTSIGACSFDHCTSLTSVSFTAVTSIGENAFHACTSLISVSLPSATSIGPNAFNGCTSLASVDFGATARSSVPTLGSNAFYNVPTSCKIIIPDSQYDAWTTASGWSGLVTRGYEFIKHSDWEAPHRYELATKEDKANKITSLSAQSTNTQYPSAKCVWDALAGKLSTSGGTVMGSITFYEPENGAVVYFPSGGKAKLYFGSGLFDVDDVTGRVTINLRDVATCASPATSGHLAALDSSGNLTDSDISPNSLAPLASPALTGTPTAPTPTAGDDSTKVATTEFVQGEKRYDLGTATTISTASQDTSGTETIDYGAATMLDRTANLVQITTALDELRVTFPATTNGKVRDFELRVEVGTGSAALTAPALVAIAPTGETITLENPDGSMPAIADGTASAKGATVLYFSETAAGKFLCKGEEVKAIS